MICVDKEIKARLGILIRSFFLLFSGFRQCSVIPGFGNLGFQQQEVYAEVYKY